jgi:tetratricopeptide (TPR) repeat protein
LPDRSEATYHTAVFGLRTGLFVFFLLCAIPTAGQQDFAASGVSSVLDAYAAGDFRRVEAQLERIGDPATFFTTLQRTTAEWVSAADVDARPARRLFAAAVAVEAAARHMESPRLGHELIEWGARILALDPPRDADRIWYLSAIALSQRALDQSLVRPSPPAGEWDLAVQARTRFPGEDRFHLAPAIVTERLSWRPTQYARLKSPNAYAAPKDVIRAFEPLLSRVTIRAEVHLRLGHTRLRLGDHAAALEHLSQVLTLTKEPFLRYLAHYFTGRAKQARGDRAGAVAAYAAALEIVPRAQSAALSLAALSFARDDRDRAFALVSDAVNGTEPVDDPWRLYQAADSRFLPGFLGLLRRATR